MATIQVVTETNPANDGLLTRNSPPIGNPRWGQRMFLSGTETPIPVANKTVKIGPFRIEGIPGAVLYTTADAFGSKMQILVPTSGIIQKVIMYDPDDEGVNTELWFFDQDFTATADNAAFAISDADLTNVEATILIDTFRNAGNNQIGEEDNLGIAYNAPSGALWLQCVTRGGPTIAAGSEPLLAISILADD